jgi:hypothetical protein
MIPSWHRHRWHRHSCLCLLPFSWAVPPAGTRPWPLLRSRDKPGSDRIIFDVFGDAAEFRLVADPMVIGLVEPEGLTGAVQNSIGRSRGDSLEPLGELGDRNCRGDQDVNVIRHQHVGVKFVLL